MPPCQLWELHEPIWVRPWRLWDLSRYRRGLPWAAAFPEVVQSTAQAVLGAAPAVGGSEEYADATVRQMVQDGVGIVPPYVQQEVTDIVLELRSVLERGDVEALRTLVAPGGHVLFGERGVESTAWIDALVPFFAQGGRVELDVRSLDDVTPFGRSVIASFAAELTVGVQQTGARVGRLDVALIHRTVNDGVSPATRTPRRWVIQGLRYVA
jgi:hypothetical protein